MDPNLDLLEDDDEEQVVDWLCSLSLAQLFRTFWIDWITSLVLLILSSVMYRYGDHHERFKMPADTSLQYPYRDDTISKVELLILVLLVPILTSIGIQVILQCRYHDWPLFVDFHHFCLGLIQAFALQELVTTSVKHAVGRFRPSADARIEQSIGNYNESYPSGHAASAFSSGVYMSLYLAGKFGLFRSSGLFLPVDSKVKSVSSFPRTMVVLIPVFIATGVLVSRLNDYAPDFSDVNAGAAIGAVAAGISYSLVYPSLGHRSCNLPTPLSSRLPFN